MTIKQLSTQAVSATGASFLVDELSAGGGTSQVPYTKIMDGRAGAEIVAAVTSLGLAVDPAPVAISGTAMVTVHNQIDASVHGQVSAFITNTVRVDLSATADVRISHQLDASVHGQVSAFITNSPRVIASNETSQVFDGTTALTPKFANISMATAGTQIIVAAVAAKKLRILNMMLVAKGAVNLYATDTGGGNNILGDSTNKIGLQAGSGFVLPYSPVGWFQTSASSAFSIVPDANTAIAGSLVYVEV